MPDTISRLTCNEPVNAASTLDSLESSIKQSQLSDDECVRIVNSIRSNKPSNVLRCPELWDVDNDGILYHSSRLFVPESEIGNLVSRIHEFGHFGVKANVMKIREKYIFPKMWEKVRNFVKKCFVCQKQKNYGSYKAPMMSLPCPGPFEFVCVDLVGPLPSIGNFNYVLTMIDNSTKWVEAVPLSSITADAVAKAMIEHWVFRWGPPVWIHSDRETQFESSLVDSLCKIIGAKKVVPPLIIQKGMVPLSDSIVL